MAVERRPTGDPRADNPLLDSRIQSAIAAELTRRGYAISPSPDFLVAYHVGVQDKIDVQTVTEPYGYRYPYRGRGWVYPGGTTRTYVNQYAQGTLMIDIVLPRERRLVWRGTAQARVHESRTPEQRTERVREAVAKILEQFPPR